MPEAKGSRGKTSRDVFSFISSFRPPRNRSKDILKQPRICRVQTYLYFNPSFNIRKDKSKTVNSMICTFTLCVLHIVYQMKHFKVNNVLKVSWNSKYCWKHLVSLFFAHPLLCLLIIMSKYGISHQKPLKNTWKLTNKEKFQTLTNYWGSPLQ